VFTNNAFDCRSSIRRTDFIYSFIPHGDPWDRMSHAELRLTFMEITATLSTAEHSCPIAGFSDLSRRFELYSLS
jgi:hypothetical protein